MLDLPSGLNGRGSGLLGRLGGGCIIGLDVICRSTSGRGSELGILGVSDCGRVSVSGFERGGVLLLETRGRCSSLADCGVAIRLSCAVLS